jgi:DNA-binding NarL/FixJ family response regulator
MVIDKYWNYSHTCITEPKPKTMNQPRSNITIGIADDNRLFVNCLQTYLGLKEEMDIIFFAENGNELIEKIEMFPPDIVLIDLKLPGKSSIKCLKEIKEKYPNTKRLIISDSRDIDVLIKCHINGANGIIDQSSQGSELVQAIRTILEKGHFPNEQITKTLYDRLNPIELTQQEEPASIKLNSKELEIIKYLYLEKTCREIADIMKTTYRSVEAHRHRLIKKLEVKSSVGIVRYAIENNLV